MKKFRKNKINFLVNQQIDLSGVHICLPVAILNSKWRKFYIQKFPLYKIPLSIQQKFQDQDDSIENEKKQAKKLEKNSVTQASSKIQPENLTASPTQKSDPTEESVSSIRKRSRLG